LTVSSLSFKFRAIVLFEGASQTIDLLLALVSIANRLACVSKDISGDQGNGDAGDQSECEQEAKLFVGHRGGPR
jgi:hypothetical protein